MEPKIVASGPNCDLSHLNLDGRDFSNQDLSYSDFHGSSLQGANFTGSILYGANFVSTNLIGAVFTGAKLIDPSVPFTNKELSDFQQEGEDIVVWEQDNLRIDAWPDDDQGYIFVDGPPAGLSGDVAELYDSLFTTGRLFRWPESRHFRATETTRKPAWFFVDTWDLFCASTDDPYRVFEDGMEFFFTEPWQAFEQSWIRSYVLHNATACFAMCEHNQSTIWPDAEQISDYPIFNCPPALVWSLVGTSTDDEWSYIEEPQDECRVCQGEYSND